MRIELYMKEPTGVSLPSRGGGHRKPPSGVWAPVGSSGAPPHGNPVLGGALESLVLGPPP
eukprot:6358739-Heterocapsa_arctica.AAC.1